MEVVGVEGVYVGQDPNEPKVYIIVYDGKPSGVVYADSLEEAEEKVIARWAGLNPAIVPRIKIYEAEEVIE